MFRFRYPPPWAEGYCFPVHPQHFCVRSHMSKLIVPILLKLGMSVCMDMRMMHVKCRNSPFYLHISTCLSLEQHHGAAWTDFIETWCDCICG